VFRHRIVIVSGQATATTSSATIARQDPNGMRIGITAAASATPMLAPSGDRQADG
jgi:hypothetical protein